MIPHQYDPRDGAPAAIETIKRMLGAALVYTIFAVAIFGSLALAVYLLVTFPANTMNTPITLGIILRVVAIPLLIALAWAAERMSR